MVRFPCQWKAAGLSLTALAAFTLSCPALAQSEGSFSSVTGYTYDYTRIQHGNATFTAGSLDGTTTVVSSSGSLFPEGQSLLRSCVIFSEEQPGGGLELKAPCTATETLDNGGDQFFLISIREEGDLGAAHTGGGGRVAIIGGTGKYTGITGRCSYETTYLSTSLGTTKADCSWRRP